MIAGAANVVASAADVTPLVCRWRWKEWGIADVLRRVGEAMKLARVWVAMVLGGMA